MLLVTYDSLKSISYILTCEPSRPTLTDQYLYKGTRKEPTMYRAVSNKGEITRWYVFKGDAQKAGDRKFGANNWTLESKSNTANDNIAELYQ